MSELKAHRIDNIISAYKIGKAFCMKTEEEVYLKSEADKVIAEKDAELRHQKYIRCLDKAALCFEKSYSTTLVRYDEKSDCLRNFYDWWGKRWLELAEKFKPNKE